MSGSTTRLAIFDLDGTLAETAPDLHAVLGEVMTEEGLPTPTLDAVRSMIGDGARILIKRAYAAVGTTLDDPSLERLFARFLAIYTAEPCRFSHLFDGVEATLDRLSSDGWALAVCTNKPQAPSVGLLRALGVLERFDAVVGGDVLPVRKPHPGHITAVLDRLAVPPARAVMVGDSGNDLAAARAAGLPCVLFTFGYTATPVTELGADHVLDRFAALPPVLAGLVPRPA